MTVTEFSKKYDIDQGIVYRASFKTPTRKEAPWYRHDIPEKELAEETYKLLAKSFQEHKDKAQKYYSMAEKIKSVIK